ncbi:serine/threonine protein kinase, partial [Paenibacillus macerans]|nr:serine/threonine protein kinase [Paenibacillus macerans]
MRFVSFLSSFYAAWRDYPVAAGTVLDNRYVVQEIVGQGSYGLIYKCVDRASGSLVAVKQARPSKGPYAKR